MRVVQLTCVSLVCMVFMSPSLAQPLQWKVVDGGNGHYYEGVSVPGGVSWDDANSTAISKGGHLVTLTSSAESSWVLDNVASAPNLWVAGSGTRLLGPYIGLYQDTSAGDYFEPDGGWRWVTGEAISFTAWLDGEPNEGSSFGVENWVHLFSGPSTPAIPEPFWNDTTIAGGPIDKVGFIVEYVPEPGTIAVFILGCALLHRRVRDVV